MTLREALAKATSALDVYEAAQAQVETAHANLAAAIQELADLIAPPDAPEEPAPQPPAEG